MSIRPATVQLALLTALALAHRGMTAVRGWCADSRLVRVRQATEIDRLRAELAFKRELTRILLIVGLASSRVLDIPWALRVRVRVCRCGGNAA